MNNNIEENKKLWVHWKIQGDEADEKRDGRWFSLSFSNQMAEIQEEIERVLRTKKLEEIRVNTDYRGEPQTIQRVFNIIKRDPKNIALHRKIAIAEQKIYAFLSGDPDAPSEKEIEEYWRNYLETYIAELRQK